MKAIDVIRSKASIAKEKVMDADIVLIDACCDGKVNGVSVIDYLKDARGVQNLDPETMRRYTREFKVISEFFQGDNVCVVPEVYSEIGRFSKILKKRLKWIRDATGLKLKKSKGKLKENSKRGLDLLNPLEQEVKNLTNVLKDNTLDLREDIYYYNILNFVNYISQNTGAKTDSSYLRGKSHIDKSKRLDADEKTIAAAYYHSFNGKKANIITRDYTNFNGLIGHTAAVLNLRDSAQSDCALRNSLLNFPVTAYYKSDDWTFKQISSSEHAVMFKTNLPEERREIPIWEIDVKANELLSQIA